ncbi:MULTISPECIES: enoyl-CoA hydratase-related protein [unclassified Pseudomonas]|uniref:enoyl-CoA hydratase-related protein n=1 Tax=unclassified Pseudomonas TaxID=196821 RepID=UPI000D335893|nr:MULTISPECIES: enoyl-CoA hydratase-related protein [unclassified Pseudomonas]RAU47984.1 enoyl-CoA hydratase [Pseudomonas sp. RIT 409]RAU55322.1 enoyl-CoA hydratase [Pseudomonas sp. RIT 412]
MSDTIVTLQRQGAVALVTLTSPNTLNPLTSELMTELGRVLQSLDDDVETRAIVLSGSSRAFAAGADIQAMAEMTYTRAIVENYLAVEWQVVSRLRKPVVAAVRGYAFGGGCELAMICDIVVAGENALFGQPEIKLGLVPGAGGTQRLPRAVGKSLAMEMNLTGEPITAAQALACGLVSRVVVDAEVVDVAMSIAQSIARHSLPVLLAVKAATARAWETSLEEGLTYERSAFHACFALDDQREGCEAFLERRAPFFSHR